MDDSDLLRRYVADGSQADFATLVRRRAGLVYSVALRRVGDPHQAQDLAQQVFVALARNARQLSSRPTILGWLHQSAHNAAVDHLRSKARRARREEEAFQMNLTDQPDADWTKARPVLDSALAALPEADRDALLLRFFDQLPFAQVGAKLNLTENAARMRVERAIGKLRDQLTKLGITSTLAALESALAQPAVPIPPTLVPAVLKGVAATSTAFGIVALMTSTKLALAAAAVALAFSGFTAYQLHLSSIQLQAARDQQAADADSLRRAKAAPASVTNPSAFWDPITEGHAYLQRHPEVAAAAARYQDAMFNTRYADFLRRSHLTSSQFARVKMLLTPHLDYPLAPGGRMLRLDPRNVPDVDDHQIDSELKQIFGDGGMQALKDQLTENGRLEAVEDFAGRLSVAGKPLTSEQCAELLESLRTTAKPNGRPDWPKALQAATAYLAPQQLEQLSLLHPAPKS